MSSPLTDPKAAARELDDRDVLGPFRERFHLPRDSHGAPRIYLNGNSLGLAPKAAAALLAQEMKDWAELAVEGHFRPEAPWYTYHELLREPLARLVGARPSEVVAMNSLTVNLHLLMVSFYRPTAERHRILIEEHAFPSDAYAVESQLRFHGFDPKEGIVVARAREGEPTLRTEDLERLLECQGASIALVLLGGVNYFTGQAFDLKTLAAAAHRAGCVFGVDLAHAAGNLALALHDHDVDFAAWCSYKYLNSGPGASAGAFVHERHAKRRDLPRFAGWWGNDPESRFDMHATPAFVPRADADGWQVSNPPIFAMAPLRASLAIFDEAGIGRLREKSKQLTEFALQLLLPSLGADLEVITPADPAARGSQLSLRIRYGARAVFEELNARGVTADFRDPDVIRIAPVPLYNTFAEVEAFVRILEAARRR